MKRLYQCLAWLFLLTGPTALAQSGGAEIVVVYNTRMPESKDVAQHYAERRHVPATQVLGFDLPTFESMSRGDYRDRLELPLLKELRQRKLWTFGSRTITLSNAPPRQLENAITSSKIRFVVLCYGVPLKISHDPSLKEKDSEKVQRELRRDEAAVDSELACLPLVEQKYQRTGFLPNPYYGSTNALFIHPTNGILMVTRLDGPTPEIARALVDKAMQAEDHGLWGRAYIDSQGLTEGNFKQGDDFMRNAALVARKVGYETVLDTEGATFPARFPLSQVALYAGWYTENVNGPFALPTVEFMPGAFAYHLHSFSAATLRSTTRQWVGPLLAKGATATMGTVDEPYLALTPDIGVFFARFLGAGYSFGEAAYACQNALSWQTTVVGDPLYRISDRNAKEIHEALERQNSPMLDWSYLRLVNLQLAAQAPGAIVTSLLENLPLTAHSPVLTEKLAELYFAEGKPASSVHALKQALELDPSPQQGIRLRLNLADRLISLDRDAEAYATLQEFVKACRSYPDLSGIYQRLAGLAQKLGKKEDAAAYEHEATTLRNNPNEPAKVPIRKGI